MIITGAVVSYDYTMFNLSLPNNRNDLLKEENQEKLKSGEATQRRVAIP